MTGQGQGQYKGKNVFIHNQFKSSLMPNSKKTKANCDILFDKYGNN